MTRTTEELQREIARLDRLIALVEAKPAHEWAIWASTLHALIEDRERLWLLVLDRRLEAGKPVVSLSRWRGGAAVPGRVTPEVAA